MNIIIEHVDNGWLVINKQIRSFKVFIDRESMMEHIDEMVPATNEESDFIDNLDDDGESNNIDYSNLFDKVL
tara:strand:- start:850 stop:1065 length:216 start_codon:yes stop_codon:yes gene_type:complete